MGLKSAKLFKIYFIIFISVFLFSISVLFFVVKDSFSKRIGEVLSVFSKKDETANSKIEYQQAMSLEIDEILNQVSESVVSIDLKKENDKGNKNSVGSGIIIDPNGLIVTNSSVISNVDSKYVVILQNSQVYPVIEIEKDSETGLVFLKINTTDLKPFNLPIQNEVKLGQKIIAIDSSVGLNNSISTGIISGINKDLKVNNLQLSNLIQTDINFFEGNLGGPITDYRGQLVGLLIRKDNLNLAISASEIKKALSRYFARGVSSVIKEESAYLGVGYFFKDLKEYLSKGEPIGPVINGIVKDSPASEAGIQVGDIVVAIDGKEFGDEEELTQFINSQVPGNKISIKIFRKGRFEDIKLILAAKD